ncbi:hypothetical protein F1880_001712 [Penicillium rolfsii]|nr:hypothetical protein F1880_001712 [Penicillium rolfsii]
MMMKTKTRVGFLLLITNVFFQFALSCPPEESYVPYCVGHNESRESFGKRAYPIKPGSNDYELWPNAQIIYCFDSATSTADQTQLRSLIPQAFKKWLTAGLSAKFEMKEGKTSECTADNRENYLLVSSNNANKLVTTLGYYHKLGTNPTMTIDLSNGLAAGNPLDNIAHELGHAWGLLHEHQRPSLWTSQYGGNARENTFVFNCENLKDYAAMVNAGNDMNRLCHSFIAARGAKGGVSFSAYNILPDDSGTDTGIAGQVDWKSIMLYGSTAGGNGASQNTLTTANGITTDEGQTTWGYNSYPSKPDCESLRALYKDILSEKKKSGSLLWTKLNPKSGLFARLNSKNNC